MIGNVPSILEEGLAQLDLPFSVGQLAKLNVFLQELERWNKTSGMSSILFRPGGRSPGSPGETRWWMWEVVRDFPVSRWRFS